MNDPIADVWIQTYTGKRYYPLAPVKGDIDIEDISHALSLLCRFGGHIDRFYSVAEHCVLLSQWVDEKYALSALLHDATEAYVVDVPRPLKFLLPEYRDLESRAWEAITKKFHVDLVLPEQVKEGDNRILINERNKLMPRHEHWSIDDLVKPLPVDITGWSPDRAKQEYLKRFSELYD